MRRSTPPEIREWVVDGSGFSVRFVLNETRIGGIFRAMRILEIDKEYSRFLGKTILQLLGFLAHKYGAYHARAL